MTDDGHGPADAPFDPRPHVYLSTSCLHGDLVLPDGRTGHEYCQGETGHCGSKTPSQCKFCAAPCVCTCHQEEPVSGYGKWETVRAAMNFTPEEEKRIAAESERMRREVKAYREAHPQETLLMDAAAVCHYNEIDSDLHRLLAVWLEATAEEMVAVEEAGGPMPGPAPAAWTAALAVAQLIAGEAEEAARYQAMINAPIRPETAKAIGERIKSGTAPRRKIRKRQESSE